MTTSVPGGLSHRSGVIEGSGIRRMFGLMASMADPVNLSIGQAHFDVPEPVRRKACEAVEDGHNRYTVTEGLPELRQGTAEYLRSRFGAVITAPLDEVLITCGVSGGLFLGYLALGSPDTKFLVYSRSFGDEAQQKRWISEAETRFPDLKGKITTY